MRSFQFSGQVFYNLRSLSFFYGSVCSFRWRLHRTQVWGISVVFWHRIIRFPFIILFPILRPCRSLWRFLSFPSSNVTSVLISYLFDKILFKLARFLDLMTSRSVPSSASKFLALLVPEKLCSLGAHYCVGLVYPHLTLLHAVKA